tara:strand:- start:861 stop:1139 length:279 start_codon:yes stop_codon:yes gene_type:complete
MKLDDVLHINTKELDNITVNGETEQLTLYEMARWSSLMLGIDHIDQRARELKMDLDKDKSWLKPLALQKYIEESTPGMVAEIKNLKENGDVL